MSEEKGRNGEEKERVEEGGVRRKERERSE